MNINPPAAQEVRERIATKIIDLRINAVELGLEGAPMLAAFCRQEADRLSTLRKS